MAKEDEIDRGDNVENNSQSEGEGDDLRQPVTDSSEEDDDDDDEEEIQKVREGFIVDDDEDEIETKKRRKHKKRKRERQREEENDELDDDDLELLLENTGLKKAGKAKVKRLKRKQGDDEEEQSDELADAPAQSRSQSGMGNMFSDDEEEEGGEGDEGISRRDRNQEIGEFDDFIEDDDISDDNEEAQRARREARNKQRKQGPRIDTSKLSNVDRQSLSELFEVFGDGNEYDWALEAQDMEDAGAGEGEAPAALDEVFEHSELKEQDNLIRIIDVPERYQKYRSALTYIDLDDEELSAEKKWIANILLKEKGGQIQIDQIDAFYESVGSAVQFISKDNLEVPFIYTYRRDYLESSQEIETPEGHIKEHRTLLLEEADLWRIVKLDIEYHSLYEKRLNTEKIIESLQLDDDLIKDIKYSDTMVGIQDIYDYIQFNYSKAIRDLANGHNGADEENSSNDASGNRKHLKFTLYEKLKSNVLYEAVQAYGITAKEFAENVQDQSSQNFAAPFRIHATDDSLESPNEIIDRLVNAEDAMFKDEKTARDAVRRTFAEEIFHNPKIRQEVRNTYKLHGLVSVAITEKGRATIDKHSQFADIKYSINNTPADLVSSPDVLLRMLEAERLGLAVIKVEINQQEYWFQSIFNCLKSDGSSENSDKWNKERETVLRLAFKKLCSMVALNTKEDLRRECERLIASQVRNGLLKKISQAPYHASESQFGFKSNVLSLTFGKGEFDNAVVGIFLKETNKIGGIFKSTENPIRSRESEDIFKGQLLEFYHTNFARSDKPDVIVVSGYNSNTKKLFDVVSAVVSENGIRGNVVDSNLSSEPGLVKVIWGPDETARLFQNSERAKLDIPDKATIYRYALGVARYVQDPLLEYISLGDDILSLTFHKHQKLIPDDSIKEAIESAFVDIASAVGVRINEAVRDPYYSQIVQYLAGLGPRKASGLLRNIISSLGSVLINRSALIQEELTTATIFNNCAGTFNIHVDKSVVSEDYVPEVLDTTRIHPEDYQLARKMASDALGNDEEDELLVDETGKEGVINQLWRDDPEKLNPLNLLDFAKELERSSGKKKFRTLQLIKHELINQFEEQRSDFRVLNNDDAFFMLTGERASELRNTVIPVTITKVIKNFNDPYSKIRALKIVTPSLIQGSIEQNHIPRDSDYIQGQVVQAAVLDVFTDTFTVALSLQGEDIRHASNRQLYHPPDKWDFGAENEDIAKERAKENAKLAKTRNIQHPLYRNFNFRQAEEYLAPQNVGDCVIRPSSKGPAFLTITWKVGNNLFQHLLVEERHQGQWKYYLVEDKRYDDLDQLIFQHIQVIAKNVTDMVHHAKFREGTLSAVHEWLESYTKANPKSSAYVFCYDHKSPGNFLLLFKINVNTNATTWHVRTSVDGYLLKSMQYPNMLSLCNGFKQTVKNMSQTRSIGYH
ncbi:SPT6 Transcription elongation factor SPT6 [Candida maltosa Xu316]